MNKKWKNALIGMALATAIALAGSAVWARNAGECGFGCKMKEKAAAMKCGMKYQMSKLKCKKDNVCLQKCEQDKATCTSQSVGK